MIKNILLPAFLFLNCFNSNFAFASEDENILPREKNTPAFFSPTEANGTGSDFFDRTLAVLTYYKVPEQNDPSGNVIDLNQVQSAAAIQKLIPFFDPSKMFSKIGNLNSSRLDIYQDLNSKKVLDFGVTLAAGNESEVDPRQNPTLSPLAEKDTRLPLQGLRIALDPGHMGGDFWDNLTGKVVSDNQGRRISEGVINLQTSLLLKAEFEKLGAVVFVTHEGLTPVSDLDYKSYDLTPFAKSELSEQVHADWFQKIIQSNPIGQKLYDSFNQSPELKKLFSQTKRDDYFIKRADLWARAKAINDFQPDIVLIIHYDTDDTNSVGGVNPKAPKQTKAYVVGGYQNTELGSRLSRSQFARHLLDQNSWNKSLRLSRNILDQIHNQLNLPYAGDGGDQSYKVDKGVFARNLMIPRFLKAPAISYLECTFYNNPEEFKMMLNAKNPMMIDGKNVPYSDRIANMANAIRDGVVQYATQSNSLTTTGTLQ